MLIAAVFLALAFGFAEVSILAVQRHVLGHFIWTPGPFVWMTPLSYLMFFAVVGCLLSLVAILRPTWTSPRSVTFVLVALGTLSLLSMLRRIHPLALVLLACGVAATMGRVVAQRPTAWERAYRRGTVLLLTLWVGALGVDLTKEQVEGRKDSTSAEASLPNVLLIVWDTVRARSLSLYGYDLETTPFLEQLANHAVVFDQAISTASWTLPAHGSLFTGRDAHELSANWLTPFGDEHRTLAEVFGEHGYRTAAFTANWAYTDGEKGLSRGFDTYVDHRITIAQVMLSSALGQLVYRWVGGIMVTQGAVDFLREIEYVHPFPGRMADRRLAADVNHEFFNWLQTESSRPFFAFLNFMDAHHPYNAPEEYLNRVGTGDPHSDAYHAAIALLDEHLQHLFERLEAANRLDHTIVVITSDHGELLGEHDLIGHGNSLYLPLLHVPLLLYAPGRVPEGTRVLEAVSLRQLPATLIEVAGIDAHLPGESLTDLWLGRPRDIASPILAEVRAGLNTPEHYPVTIGDMWSVTTSRYHYIVDGLGRVELYDHRQDPLELHDLAQDQPGSLPADLETEVQAAEAILRAGPRPLPTTDRAH